MKNFKLMTGALIAVGLFTAVSAFAGNSDKKKNSNSMLTTCKADIKKFCRDESYIKLESKSKMEKLAKNIAIHECLEDHTQDLEPGCKYHIKNSLLSHRLDTKNFCMPEIKQYCDKQSIFSNAITTAQSNGGDHYFSIMTSQMQSNSRFLNDSEGTIDCLGEAKDYLSKTCKAAVSRYDNFFKGYSKENYKAGLDEILNKNSEDKDKDKDKKAEEDDDSSGDSSDDDGTTTQSTTQQQSGDSTNDDTTDLSGNGTDSNGVNISQ